MSGAVLNRDERIALMLDALDFARDCAREGRTGFVRNMLGIVEKQCDALDAYQRAPTPTPGADR